MSSQRRPRWILAGLVTVCVTLGLTTAAAADPPVSPERGTVHWSIKPSVDALVTTRGGRIGPTTITEFGTHPIDAAVNSVYATLDAMVPAGSGVEVDVRGLRGDGSWSEWSGIVPGAFAVLPERTRSVQTRLVRTAPANAAAPWVRSIDLTAWNAVETASRQAITTAAGNTYQVFATREGLVGQTTANGHVITDRDHFVALPARRGLAGKGTGDYTARVCTASGSRCEWAPVWDVGPWNTRDDYWNPGRQSWADLPQGRPEAQAAYSDGYNGGQDQFGRTVRNPAAIDLADGVFWDGLQLTTNSYVDVTYQWSGSGAWGTIVTAGDPLDVRGGPESSAPQAGLAARYANVRIECQVVGEPVDGPQGSSDVWYRLAPGKYVARAHVEVGSAAAPC